jgi:hypothetical protein
VAGAIGHAARSQARFFQEEDHVMGDRKAGEETEGEALNNEKGPENRGL